MKFEDLKFEIISEGIDAGKIAILNSSSENIYVILDNLSSIHIHQMTSNLFGIYTGENSISISGIPEEDQVLSLDVSNVNSLNETGFYSVKWEYLQFNNSWETLSTDGENELILTQDHVGKEIRSVITFEDNFGLIRSLSSNITSPIQNINDLPQGLPSVNGDTLIGNILSYNLSNLYDEDGLGDISTIWQSSYDNINWEDVSSDSNLNLNNDLLGQAA